MGLFDFKIDNSTFASTPWKHNISYWASFELYPEWKGSEFYVFRGAAFHQRDYFSQRYVVVKTFRNTAATSTHWLTYKERCDVGNKMAANFNQYLQRSHCNTKIGFVKPTDALMDSISDVMPLTRLIMRFKKSFSTDEAVLFEDLLEGDFKTFVTNKGKTTCDGIDALDAFSHFTYQASGNTLVVCHLKGVENEDHSFMFTNPVIHSTDQSYGKSDRGQHGIDLFFQYHICSALCNSFSKPGSVKTIPSCPRFEFDEGTTTSADNTDQDENTRSKELEAGEVTKNILHSPQLPEYSSVDPFAPPPYPTD